MLNIGAALEGVKLKWTVRAADVLWTVSAGAWGLRVSWSLRQRGRLWSADEISATNVGPK